MTVVGTFGQDPDKEQKISWRVWVVVALCALAQMQNTFISVAPAAAAYSIAGPLGGTTSERIWIIQAASVPSIATGPIMAIISDVYGRRYLVIGVWLIFCVTAVVSMTAKNMSTLIAGQALSGVAMGISGIMYSIAGEVMPSVYRAWSQTIVNVSASTASVFALIAMGAAIHNDAIDGWRWIYRFLLILNAILLVGFTVFYHPPPRTVIKSTFFEKVKTLDWIGYFLLISGLVPLLMGLAWSSDPTYGWHNAHSYGPVAVGCVGFIACLIYEWKGTSTGFLDHRLFQSGRNFPLAMLLVAVEGSLFYLINNIYPSEVNGLWAEPGSMNANARLLPFFLVIFAVAPIMSYYVTRTKDLKWPLCAGFICFAVATIGLAMSGLNGAMATAFNGVGGIGFSAPLILLMSLVQLSTPPLFIGVASALTISVRTLGGCVGYAIAMAIYGALTNDQVPANILKAVIPLGFDPINVGALIGFLSSGQGMPEGTTGQMLGAASAAMKSTQAHGYKIVWFAFLPGSIIAAIGCACLKNPRERMNWVVDAPLNTKEAGADTPLEAGDAGSTSQEKTGSV
ncbi:major facilitator superfamily domain-containing protein [Leucosporidium creatinivorum]|uniref:Major facilitator superfamily domain-containing protein n=1 Tax=Leucosporidium creatinivorum TaxID=106004 RepID=A0A1Y2FU01_9BASI|nr:major facilitator superfamily domain-containing protein [Leucosporidium creatinivorum]